VLRANQGRWFAARGVIDLWNQLLRHGVDPKILHGFKERLEKFTEEKALQDLYLNTQKRPAAQDRS